LYLDVLRKFIHTRVFHTNLFIYPHTQHYNNKNRYIVPRYFGKEDRELALDLEYPILAPQRPELVQLLSSASECRQLFDEAKILTAPGVHDIYDTNKLIKVLAKLIVAYPFTERWLFRLNHELMRRGDAVLDVNNTLSCIESVRNEYVRYGAENTEYWSRHDVQERLQTMIRTEMKSRLSRRLDIRCEDAYVFFSSQHRHSKYIVKLTLKHTHTDMHQRQHISKQ